MDSIVLKYEYLMTACFTKVVFQLVYTCSVYKAA